MEWTNSFDVCLELHMTAAKKIYFKKQKTSFKVRYEQLSCGLGLLRLQFVIVGIWLPDVKNINMQN